MSKVHTYFCVLKLRLLYEIINFNIDTTIIAAVSTVVVLAITIALLTTTMATPITYHTPILVATVLEVETATSDETITIESYTVRRIPHQSLDNETNI